MHRTVATEVQRHGLRACLVLGRAILLSSLGIDLDLDLDRSRLPAPGLRRVWQDSRLADVGENDVDILVELCVLGSLETGRVRARQPRLRLGTKLDRHPDTGDSRVPIDDEHVGIAVELQLVVVELDPGQGADEQVVSSVVERSAVIADHDVALEPGMLDDDRLSIGLGVERERLIEVDDGFLGGHRLACRCRP